MALHHKTMIPTEFRPTSYDDVNRLLWRWLVAVSTLLDNQFVGMYLHGSLALGDFDPHRSDIDAVVVTAGELSNGVIHSLAKVHDQLAHEFPHWGNELENSYIPKEAIRRQDPANHLHPRIERGERLKLAPHYSDWIIQRCILLHWGIVVFGPAPDTLIDPLGPGDLRQAILGILWWWEQQLIDTSLLEKSGWQVYAVLTMCRILYTLHHGSLASKPVSANWAQQSLARPWDSLIDQVLAWQDGEEMGQLEPTLALIRYTLKYSQGFEDDSTGLES